MKMVPDLEDLMYEKRLKRKDLMYEKRLKEIQLMTQRRERGDLITIHKLMNNLEETDRNYLMLRRKKGWIFEDKKKNCKKA